MTSRTLAGHVVEFQDCHELGQAGPDTCTMSIDGEPVIRRLLFGSPHSLRFHPTPLEYQGDVLAPLWHATRFHLVRIDPRSLEVRLANGWMNRWGYGFMRLLSVAGDEVEFCTSVWDESQKRTIKLRT